MLSNHRRTFSTILDKSGGNLIYPATHVEKVEKSKTLKINMGVEKRFAFPP
jgi:hypothetical protein